MTEPAAPYREPGARAPLSDAERRWFTRKGDVEKGPYALDVLTRSIKSGVLKRTSLVRAEDETQWRPVHEVPAIMAAVNPKVAAGWTHDARPHDGGDGSGEGGGGSFGLGFASGFFGGIIGFVLVRGLATGDDTKKGAAYGLGLGLIIGAVIRLAVMQH
ncbi:MAG: DUF4339 domain-containing protein [Polyangiaceae bacterium]|jgi:hypothetical protein